MVREEWDRAAARRVEENAALRALFARRGGVVADTGSASAGSTQPRRAGDASLLCRELERANDALRALLIELHAHVEEQRGPGARALDDAIWRELVASTERRRLSLAPF